MLEGIGREQEPAERAAGGGGRARPGQRQAVGAGEAAQQNAFVRKESCAVLERYSPSIWLIMLKGFTRMLCCG